MKIIDEVSEAAENAIEQAAAEAARAAVLASLEREMTALSENQKCREEIKAVKTSRVKTAVITGLICFLVGSIFGGVASTALTLQ